MLLTALELENFKSYRQETIHFQPGTNAITGANGAGKSSLLEAIGLVLFDYKEGSFSQYLSEGTAAARVVVQFISYDERRYEVERCFGKTTTRYRAYDCELGTILAEGDAAVKAWLRQHLQVEPTANLDDLFSHTIGVPQGTFTAPFLENASMRKKIFDPLLQVEEYQKAKEKLLATANYLKDQAVQLGEEIAELRGQLTNLPKLQEQLAVLAQELEGDAQELAERERDLAQVMAQVEALDAAERQVREREARWEKAQGDLAAQRQLLAGAQEDLAAAEAAEAQVAATREGHEAYIQAEARLADLEEQRRAREGLLAKRAQLEQERARLAERLQGLEQTLAEIARAAQRLEALRPSVAQQVAQEEALRRAEEEALRLDLARRAEAQAAAEVQRAQQDLEAKRLGLAEAAALEQKAQEGKARLDALRQEKQAELERRARIVAELERLAKQAQSLAEAQAARCPVCEAELTPERRQALLRHNQEERAALEGEQRAVAERLRRGEEEMHRLAQALEDMERRLRALPRPQDVDQAEAALRQSRERWQNDQAEVAALAEAPAKVEAQRRALEALGDPRSEAQRLEGQVHQRPARERERQETLARAEAVDAEMQRLEGDLAPYEGLEEAIAEAQRARQSHRQAHDTYLAHARIAQQVGARRARVQELGAQVDRLAQQVAALEGEYRAALVGYDAPAHARLREQANQLRDRVAAVREKLQLGRRRQKELHNELLRLQGLEATLERQERRREELNTLLGLLQEARELLQKAGPYVTRQLVSQISREASAFYGEIMGDHTGRLNWSEDYELSLEYKGRERTFRQLSGGEQMIAALALRLALLRKISALDVAFFDEPTAHLDPERREGLADKIMQVKGFAQMFVISHDDTFERVAQNYIRIVKDEQGSHWMREG